MSEIKVPIIFHGFAVIDGLRLTRVEVDRQSWEFEKNEDGQECFWEFEKMGDVLEATEERDINIVTLAYDIVKHYDPADAVWVDQQGNTFR